MIIQLDSMIEEAKSVDDLKPLLKLIVKALNTTSDAKTQVRGDSVYHDGGITLRCNDGNYWLMTLKLDGGSPINTAVAVFTKVGPNPTGA